jgi:hypothetical protein
MTRPFSLSPGEASRGVALIVTLMMMSVLVMMVIGLAGVMRNEQAAARNLTYQVLAEQLAEIGTRQAMGIVRSNSIGINPRSLKATGPGWMVCDGSQIPLYPVATNQGSKNVEELGTNSLILSLGTNPANRGILLAGWSNLSTGAPTVPFGRYTWWVDDEGGKLNVNYTGSSRTRILPWTADFPFGTSHLFLDPVTATAMANAVLWSGNLEGRTNWIFTSESLKDTNAVSATGVLTNPVQVAAMYRQSKGHVTAWASNVNMNPYGQRKYGASNLANAATAVNDTDFGNLLQATFANPNLTNTNNLIFFRRDFTEKYGNGDRGLGNLVLRQAMANTYEAIRFNPANITNAPLQSSNLSTLSGTGITNVPRDWQGLSPASLYLNEICAQAFYFNNPPNQCQFQIWVYVELVNLSSTNTPNDVLCLLGPDNPNTNRISITGRTAAGTFSNNILLAGYFKTNGSSSVNIGGVSTNVAAYGLFTTRAWFVFAGMFDTFAGNLDYRVPQAGTMQAMSIANFRIGNVGLIRKFNRGRTLVPVDWIQAPLPAMNFGALGVSPTGLVPAEPGSGNGAFSFSATDPGAPGVAPPVGANAIGFSKIDPRFRVFPGWVGAGGLSNFSAWMRQVPSYGTENRLNPAMLAGWNLLADRALPTNFSDGRRARIWWPGDTLLYTNTNSPLPAWTLNGTNLPGVGSLGFIHTGLPWRTFRLGPQEADPAPPDWLVVDLFSAGNPTNSVPAINLNSQYQALAGSTRTNRLPMVVNLLSTLTNNVGALPLWSSNWSSVSLGQAFSNLLSTNANRWIGTSWWDNGRRTAGGPATNPALFFFGGELAEIRGVGDVGTTDEDREAPLVVAGDLVTARSDTFSVWSVGQGLQVVTNSAGVAVRTNLMAEVRKQTVFQRVPTGFDAGANNNVRGFELRVLYTRNHIVE